MAAIISDLLGIEVKRRVRQHDGDSDLIGVDKWSIEVKNCSTLQLNAWWAQTVAQAGNSLPDAGTAAKKVKDEFGDLMTRLQAKDSGLDASFGKDLQTLFTAYKSGKLDIDEYRTAVEKLIGQQKFAMDIAKDAAKAQEDFNKALEKARQERAKAGQDVQDKAAAMERELQNYGLLESAIYDKTVADLEESRILAMKEGDAHDVIASLDAQIDGYKRLAAAKRGIEAKDEAKKAAEDAAKAWENFSRDIEQSLTDALMRSFEAGASFGETFAKTLQNTFKSMILKVAVQAIVSPVTGALQSAMTGKDPTMGMFGTNTLSTGGSLYNLATGSVGGGLYGAFATSGIGQSLGLSYMSHVGAAGPLATAAPTLSGLGTALPYIGAALAVASLFSKESTPHAGASGFSSGADWYPLRNDAEMFAQFAEGEWPARFTGDRNHARFQQSTADALQPLMQGLAGTLNSITREYGLGRGYRVGATFTSDGDDDSRARIVFQDQNKHIFADDYRKYNKDPGKGFEQFAQEAANQLLVAVRDLDIDPYIDQWLDKSLANNSDALDKLDAAASQMILSVIGSGELDEFLATMDLAGQSFDEVTREVVAFARVFTLKPIFDALALDIYKVGNALADAFGGADAAGAALSAYYDNFYTDEEKIANVQALVTAEFAKWGAAVPASVEEFRALGDAIAAMGPDGAEAYAALVSISPAFKQVADAADSAKKATDDLAAANEKAAESARKAAEAERQAALESYLSAMQSVVQAAMEGVSRAVDAEREAIAAAYQASVDALNTSLNAATEKAASLQRLSDTLRNFVDDAQAMSLQQAGAQVQASLAIARAGGTLPLDGQLDRALRTMAADNGSSYATAQEFRLAQVRNTAAVRELAEITDDQLSVEEQAKQLMGDQLKVLEQTYSGEMDRLDGILKSSGDQVAALQGIDTSVKSVADAMRALANALGGAKTAQTAVYAAAEAGNVAALQAESPYYATQRENLTAQALSAANQGNIESTKALAAEAIKYGSAAQIAAEVSRQTGTNWTADNLIDWARENNVPGYAAGGIASGLSLVGEKGPELIVTPPARVFSNSDTRSMFDISALLDEVKALRAEVRAVAVNTFETAKKSKRLKEEDGAMLVKVVTA